MTHEERAARAEAKRVGKPGGVPQVASSRRNGRPEPVRSAGRDDETEADRFFRRPLVTIFGILLFNVFYIAFLILRAVWRAQQRRGGGTPV